MLYISKDDDNVTRANKFARMEYLVRPLIDEYVLDRITFADLLFRIEEGGICLSLSEGELEDRIKELEDDINELNESKSDLLGKISKLKGTIRKLEEELV